MPLINIHHASDLTGDQIEELMERLTEAYASVTNASPSAVHVLVQQVPADRWGVGGESLARRKARPA